MGWRRDGKRGGMVVEYAVAKYWEKEGRAMFGEFIAIIVA